MEGGLQELEETTYWIELLLAAEIMHPREAHPLLEEANELTAIMVTMVRTVKQRARR